MLHGLAVFAAGHGAGQVEAEAVHVHLAHPVVQAVDDVAGTIGWLQLTVLPQPV
jgi:hypothetical protein